MDRRISLMRQAFPASNRPPNSPNPCSSAYSTDRGQRSGRSRTPWVGRLSDGLDGRSTVRHRCGTLSANDAGAAAPSDIAGWPAPDCVRPARSRPRPASHLRTSFAFSPRAIATAAIDAPGCAHCARTFALNSAACTHLVPCRTLGCIGDGGVDQGRAGGGRRCAAPSAATASKGGEQWLRIRAARRYSTARAEIWLG